MSARELDAYGKWFLSVLPERIRVLTAAVRATPGFESWVGEASPESLNALGEWFASAVSVRPRTDKEEENIYAAAPVWFREVTIPGIELTDVSFSIAFDVGLYLSTVFQNEFPHVRWRMQRGRKADVDYGQMVLEGFGRMYFNPVRMMVTLAYGLADRSKSAKRLREIYEIWGEYAAHAAVDGQA
jgi:hypothetical protein